MIVWIDPTMKDLYMDLKCLSIITIRNTFSDYFLFHCDFASLLLLLYHFYYNGRGQGLTVGKQYGNSVVIRIVIAQWRDLVG